jgi:hypothetical protein
VLRRRVFASGGEQPAGGAGAALKALRSEQVSDRVGAGRTPVFGSGQDGSRIQRFTGAFSRPAQAFSKICPICFALTPPLIDCLADALKPPCR